MTVYILPFSMENYDEVLSLWKSCDGIGLSGADSPGNMRLYLERNPAMSHIAADQDRILGAALCGHDGRRGYLHHIAVLPEFRNQGIAKRLVDKCLKALQAAGIQKCHLFIFKDNREGFRFWKKIGWSYREDLAVFSSDIDPDG